MGGFLNKRLSVIIGQEFSVSEPSNPSTGFLWDAHYDPKEFDLTESGMTFTSSPVKLGGPGDQYFKFLPKAVGNFSIRLYYQRPWEHYPNSLYIYNIDVKP